MDNQISTLAALIRGECWINADACALLLGIMCRGSGKPNRRAFMEKIACRPDFPRQHPVTKSWRKSEVLDWAEEVARKAA